MSRKYRFSAAATSTAVAALVAFVVAGSAGCGGFSEQVRQDEPEAEADVSGLDTATGLYEAMITVFDKDTEGIEQSYEESLTVVSFYESLNEQRRRRFVGRIVPVGRGIGVRITAEYQNEVSQDGEEAAWEDEPREMVEAEAEPEELSMAREVERTYHRGE